MGQVSSRPTHCIDLRASLIRASILAKLQLAAPVKIHVGHSKSKFMLVKLEFSSSFLGGGGGIYVCEVCVCLSTHVYLCASGGQRPTSGCLSKSLSTLVFETSVSH